MLAQRRRTNAASAQRLKRFTLTIILRRQICIEKKPAAGWVRKIQRMDYQPPAASDTPDESSPVNSEIESLARETRAPHELVRKLYATECAKLEKMAKIKTYVPVLIRRRVKALLQEKRGATHL
jgi:hypothetical protein